MESVGVVTTSMTLDIISTPVLCTISLDYPTLLRVDYTVSIRAVSTHSAVGELRSDAASITQVITTNVSGECE